MFETDEWDDEPMRLEYKQQRYRSEDGRFDGNLNKMAAEGWKCESILPVGDTFLVTYSRMGSSMVKVDHVTKENLERAVAANVDAGNVLISMTSTSHLHDTYFTLAWEVTRPGPQPTFDLELGYS